MEQGLESYDVCTSLLQGKAISPEGSHYTITLPNLRSDAVISVEEVGVVKKKKTAIFFNCTCNFNLCRCSRGTFNTLRTFYELDTNLDDGAAYGGDGLWLRR